jgi:hypothetical protein
LWGIARAVEDHGGAVAAGVAIVDRKVVYGQPVAQVLERLPDVLEPGIHGKALPDGDGHHQVAVEQVNVVDAVEVVDLVGLETTVQERVGLGGREGDRAQEPER